MIRAKNKMKDVIKQPPISDSWLLINKFFLLHNIETLDIGVV